MERRYHIFWPLFLIAAGVTWILILRGTIPASNLWALVYTWPVLLIGAGARLLLRPYWSYAGAIISVLMVAAMFLGVLFAGPLGWNRIPGSALTQDLWIGGPVARGSGHVVSQTRSVAGFTTVRVSYPASVVIRQGPSEALTIDAEDNVASSIRTQVSNGILEIDGGPDHRVSVVPTRPVQINITVKDLTNLEFNAAGDVTVIALKTQNLDASLDGAGNIKFDDLNVVGLQATLSGVGSLVAGGKAEELRVQVDGVGSFDGADLKTQRARVSLNGMGGATVWAEDTLDAEVNGMGSVNYFGGARLSKSINGLGSVNYQGFK